MKDRRSDQGPAVRKRRLIQLLKKSMAKGRLVLRYQPIVDLRRGTAVAAEALLQWRDGAAEKGSLSGLIIAAEHSPVIFALDLEIAESASRHAAAWQKGPLPGLRLNLNLSARELGNLKSLARLEDAFRAAGIDPHALTLEVTETAAIHEPDQVAPVLDRLKQQGIEVWLDDFGTGHSSLAWLSSLPIDGLKLPGQFIRKLGEGSKCEIIVPALINLAHDLGLRVVAEGVETEGQLASLRAYGCDAVQGLLLYEAMEPDMLVTRLKAEQPTPGAAARGATRGT